MDTNIMIFNENKDHDISVYVNKGTTVGDEIDTRTLHPGELDSFDLHNALGIHIQRVD